MDRDEFYNQRNDRTSRYGERLLDAERRILITADDGYLRELAGQVAFLTLTNLLGRMSPRVSVAVADVPLHAALPFQSESLVSFALDAMRAADPYGCFTSGTPEEGDYVLHLGCGDHERIVHGSGWNAYVGPGPSPLTTGSPANPFGAAFAAVMAAALIFKPPFPERIEPRVADVLRWRASIGSDEPFERPDSLGSVWIVGAGSVGSAAAYFLCLAGLRFSATLLDMDHVKVHNLDRSPIFTFDDAEARRDKVAAVERFLIAAGIPVEVEKATLRQSKHWASRQEGTPDLLIPAANEDDVRYLVEQSFPPVQVFGTTGKSWQATSFCLVPPQDPCTCCIFPPETPADTDCATDKAEAAGPGEEQVDAALPFLSFAAGLMTVIEVAKLEMQTGAPSKRAYFQPLSDEVVVSIEPAHRPGCLCADRRHDVHKAMIAHSRYSNLSRF